MIPKSKYRHFQEFIRAKKARSVSPQEKSSFIQLIELPDPQANLSKLRSTLQAFKKRSTSLEWLPSIKFKERVTKYSENVTKT
jgi:hypothetical protein